MSGVGKTTWVSAPLPGPDATLAEIREWMEIIRARGPVPERIEHRAGERIPWEELGIQTIHDVEEGLVGLAGLRVVSNPDVPPGEVWIPQSDGTTLKIVNVALPESGEP